VFTGVVAARQTGDPTIGLMSGVMAFGAALVPFAFVGLAARLQRPWLREVPSAPVTDTALAWPVAVECFVAYLALYLGAQAVAGLFAASVRSATVGLVVAQVVSGVVAVAFTLWRLRSAGANRREIGVGRSRLPGDVWAGFAGWAMLSPVVALLGVLSHRLLEDRVGLPPNPVLPLMSRPDPLVRGLLVFMAVAVAPVLEEFFFRGVLFSALRRRIGPVRGSLLTGIAFASLHPVVDWLPILGLSTGLCWLRHRRDSLVPAVVAHFFQNGTASLATLILFG
jgi:membrane protease YdiL (CAAX protease family)